MVIMNVTPPIVSGDDVHVATDWQISTTKDFNTDDIVVESLNDQQHLYTIIFDIDLDPNKIYYGRARLRFNNYVSNWSEIDVIEYADAFKINIVGELPGVVSRPVVSLNYPNVNTEYDNVPGTLFKILTTPMTATSNTQHIASNYIITDILGNVKHTNLNDTENKTSYLFKDVLEAGQTYIAFVSHVSSSGDISKPGGVVFTVYDVPEIEVTSDLTDVNVTDGYALTLNPVDDVTNIYLTIYGVADDDYDIIYQTTTTNFTIGLPTDIVKPNISEYILAIQYEHSDGSKTKVKYYKLENVH